MKVSLKLPSEAKQAILTNDLNLVNSVRLLKGKVYGNKGKTFLHYIAKYCEDSLLAGFCINKLKVNPNSLSKKGKVSPLHTACKYGKVQTARFLLALPQINKELQDNDGETPLTIACKYNQTEVALLLLQQGANVQSQNKKNWTALHWASKKGNYLLVTILIQAGINPSVVTKNNENCLHLAAESGCVQTIETLLKLIFPLLLSNKGTLLHHSYQHPEVQDYLLTNTTWKDFPKLQILLEINAPVYIIMKHCTSELGIKVLGLIIRFDRADILQEMSSRHLISENDIGNLSKGPVFGKCEVLLRSLNRWQSVKKILFVHKFSMKTIVNLPQGLLRELIMYI